MYVLNKDREYKNVGEGTLRKVLAYSDNIMNVELKFEKGAVGAMHKHPHEQIGYVIEGTLIYKEENKEDVALSAGDTYLVPSGVMHGIECLTEVKLLDIFTPMREDFI